MKYKHLKSDALIRAGMLDDTIFLVHLLVDLITMTTGMKMSGTNYGDGHL